MSSIQTVMASALVLGCATASVTLWYFSRRYVGELSLLKGGPAGRPSRLCFSVLDFWGNREVCSLQTCHSTGILMSRACEERWIGWKHVMMPCAVLYLREQQAHEDPEKRFRKISHSLCQRAAG